MIIIFGAYFFYCLRKRAKAININIQANIARNQLNKVEVWNNINYQKNNKFCSARHSGQANALHRNRIEFPTSTNNFHHTIGKTSFIILSLDLNSKLGLEF